ncbi:MAG: hypothetical protein KKH29_02455 [Candidatus Omnitrophica bacterium]|nr:hypothetical protein [Candidatus Omnitrophota bacterium]MCG2707029.1 hypothetical protein [Candidatus Omnitrophota bacterium]
MRKPNLSLSILSLTLFCVGMFVSPAGAGPSFQKGICYAAWERNRYLSTHSDRSLEELARTGAEWVAIVTTYYQDRFDSTAIYATEITPSDESIIHVINRAHQLGLKVMLKPHLNLLDRKDGLCRLDIGFQNQHDWQAWFTQYLDFILHYAKMAEETGAELFCIGTELSFTTQKQEFWKDSIIPSIKRVYSGELIYAANWDTYENIRFWNELDYIGIDAYFSLTEKGSPDYEEIEAAWMRKVDEVERYQKKINKPIIFTEIGYRSCEFSAVRP